jgi:hypothetical protein
MRKLPGVDHINIKENGIVVWILLKLVMLVSEQYNNKQLFLRLHPFKLFLHFKHLVT